MGRSPTATPGNCSVKTEEVEKVHAMTLKQETHDIKPEDVPLSVSPKVETNSVDHPAKKTRMIFSHMPSVKTDSLATFTQITCNIYQDEDLGESAQQVDVMSCECKPTISGSSPEKRCRSNCIDEGVNTACGDNDCINFATSMECTDDDECHCGSDCRNRRFQRCEYANIDVIQTEKKGYGIRTNSNIPAHTFIYEYVGEIIGEGAFRNRMHDYDDQGI